MSVARPAPVMHDDLVARAKGEILLRESGLRATVLRPCYMLGPGHRWPYSLVPVYWIAERIPSLRDGARRLGLVTLAQMVRALVAAVETPPARERILGVPEIRAVNHTLVS